MNDTVLLTGASGFLGNNILDRIIDEHIPYIAISKHGDEKKGILALDLTDPSGVKNFVSTHEFSTIFHLAGYVNLTRDYSVAKQCIENNILGTLNLLEACDNTKLKKFIYSSTEEIYGNNSLPYIETQSPFPPSPYSISKVATENLVRYYSEKNHFESIILRLATMYGPHMKSTKFLSNIIVNAINNQTILLNSGQKKRNYIFVSDVVDAFLLANKTPLLAKTITLNIGGNTSIKLKDFVSKIIKVAESSSKIKYGVIPERPSESSEWIMDITLAKKILGWSPKINLTAGLKKTINFYKTC
jgi:nucleoside-diphosphate-sugar epimerase